MAVGVTETLTISVLRAKDHYDLSQVPKTQAEHLKEFYFPDNLAELKADMEAAQTVAANEYYPVLLRAPTQLSPRSRLPLEYLLSVCPAHLPSLVPVLMHYQPHHTTSVSALCYVPEDNVLYTASKDMTLRVVHVQAVGRGGAAQLTEVACGWFPDGGHVTSLHVSGEYLWACTNGGRAATFLRSTMEPVASKLVGMYGKRESGQGRVQSAIDDVCVNAEAGNLAFLLRNGQVRHVHYKAASEKRKAVQRLQHTFLEPEHFRADAGRADPGKKLWDATCVCKDGLMLASCGGVVYVVQGPLGQAQRPPARIIATDEGANTIRAPAHQGRIVGMGWIGKQKRLVTVDSHGLMRVWAVKVGGSKQHPKVKLEGKAFREFGEPVLCASVCETCIGWGTRDQSSASLVRVVAVGKRKDQVPSGDVYDLHLPQGVSCIAAREEGIVAGMEDGRVVFLGRARSRDAYNGSASGAAPELPDGVEHGTREYLDELRRRRPAFIVDASISGGVPHVRAGALFSDMMMTVGLSRGEVRQLSVGWLGRDEAYGLSGNVKVVSVQSTLTHVYVLTRTQRKISSTLPLPPRRAGHQGRGGRPRTPDEPDKLWEASPGAPASSASFMFHKSLRLLARSGQIQVPTQKTGGGGGDGGRSVLYVYERLTRGLREDMPPQLELLGKFSLPIQFPRFLGVVPMLRRTKLLLVSCPHAGSSPVARIDTFVHAERTLKYLECKASQDWQDMIPPMLPFPQVNIWCVFGATAIVCQLVLTDRVQLAFKSGKLPVETWFRAGRIVCSSGSGFLMAVRSPRTLSGAQQKILRADKNICMLLRAPICSQHMGAFSAPSEPEPDAE